MVILFTDEGAEAKQGEETRSHNILVGSKAERHSGLPTPGPTLFPPHIHSDLLEGHGGKV